MKQISYLNVGTESNNISTTNSSINSTPPSLGQKRRTTRWGPVLNVQMLPSILAHDDTEQEPMLGSLGSQHHSEHVIIANDESRPQTQSRDFVDSNDGSIESSFTNSHCVDSVHSDDGTLESSSICTPGGSHFCVLGDESIGFDTFENSYASISPPTLR